MKRLIYLLAFGSSLVFNACVDLDLVPHNQIASGSMWTTPDLALRGMNGLYDENADNKKKSEMEKRIKIINESSADLMISIHMNSFPLSSCSGAQVFYAKGSEVGQNLAKSVQNAICQSFDNARDFVSVGDYFVLNYSNIPSVLVECGFLSNPQEEINLQNDDYCNLFCYSVLVGILEFFKM